jgi:hypothetical protein
MLQLWNIQLPMVIRKVSRFAHDDLVWHDIFQVRHDRLSDVNETSMKPPLPAGGSKEDRH